MNTATVQYCAVSDQFISLQQLFCFRVFWGNIKVNPAAPFNTSATKPLCCSLFLFFSNAEFFYTMLFLQHYLFIHHLCYGWKTARRNYDHINADAGPMHHGTKQTGLFHEASFLRPLFHWITGLTRQQWVFVTAEKKLKWSSGKKKQTNWSDPPELSVWKYIYKYICTYLPFLDSVKCYLLFLSEPQNILSYTNTNTLYYKYFVLIQDSSTTTS